MKYLLSLFIVVFLTGCAMNQETVEPKVEKKQINCKSFSVGKERFDCYYKQAQAGDIRAQSWIGYYYAQGDIVPKDLNTSNYWFLKAAKAGDTYSQAELGINYLYQKKYKDAQYWLEKAANKGDIEAIKQIGYLYDTGVKGIIKEDKQKAYNFFKEGVKKNDAYSQYYLGYYYKRGWIVPKDYVKAMHWYKKSASGGDQYAMGEIGYLYAKGLGVERNYDIAFEWFEKAAKKGDKYSMGWLGYLYEQGFGAQKNLNLAIEWYKKSGNAYSKKRLAKLNEKGLR